jgi:hypothetical protein
MQQDEKKQTMSFNLNVSLLIPYEFNPLIAESPLLTNQPLLISILLHHDDNQTNLFDMIITLSNLSMYTGLHLFKAFLNPTCRARIIQAALLHVIQAKHASYDRTQSCLPDSSYLIKPGIAYPAWPGLSC